MDELQQRTIKAIVNVFETGKVAGNYSAVGVLPGDSGHLSYGRSQATLGSGALSDLLTEYTQRTGAQFAGALAPWMPRTQAKDMALDHDAAFTALLKAAGNDPVMRQVQDDFFDRRYFLPACQAAARAGIATALGLAVVYDGCVQGGWGLLKNRLPAVAAAGGEKAWIPRYVALRREWLTQGAPPLPSTAYRMDTFLRLIQSGNWALTLPLDAHNTAITEADLA
jgi:chitosanase